MLSHIKKLLIGNGLAQALQFLSTLVLSRIYYPSDFGVLAQVQSISTVAAIVSTLQLHLSIPLCKSNDEARTAAETVQSICVVLFAVFLPVALYFGKVFVFSVFLMLFLGLANTYNSYLVFSGSFGRLSGFYIVRAILIITLQIGFAVLSVKDGLLWGAIIGEGMAALYLRVSMLGSLWGIQIDLRAALEMGLRLRSFSMYGTLQELISVSAFYAPLLLFTYKFGESIGGQYAMANRLVWAPVVLLSSSIAQVLYHSFGKSPPGDRGSLEHLFLNKKIVFGALAVCALSFYLEDAFLLALGIKWGLASKLIPLNLLWGYFFLLSTPFRVMCRVIQLQKYQLIVDALTLTAIALLFAFSDLAPLQMMWGLAIVAMAQHSILSAAVWSTLNRRIEKVAS